MSPPQTLEFWLAWFYASLNVSKLWGFMSASVLSCAEITVSHGPSSLTSGCQAISVLSWVLAEPWGQRMWYRCLIIAKHYTGICSLHLDLLWVFTLITVHSQKSFSEEVWELHESVGARGKCLVASFILCQFRKIITVSLWGPMFLSKEQILGQIHNMDFFMWGRF